jgi:hypothetical protein
LAAASLAKGGRYLRAGYRQYAVKIAPLGKPDYPSELYNIMTFWLAQNEHFFALHQAM